MVNYPIPVAGFEEFPITDLERNIQWRFESQAARYPDHIAIEEKQQSWTYRALNECANRIAQAILHTEASDDNPVALFFAPGFNAVASILGVLKSGRAWVPMVPGGPAERFRALLTEASSSLVLTDSDHIDEASTLAGKGAKVVPIECVSGFGNGNNLGLHVPSNKVSNIVFTSGSTGRPKGVIHTHAVVLSNIMVNTNALYLTCKDRICQAASYTTLAGATSIFRALLNGATLLPFDTAAQGAASFAQWLIEKRVTVCQIVPTLFRLMIQSMEESVTFPDMRILHLGGEPVYRNDVLDFRKRFPKTCCLLYNLGSSEALTIRQYFIDHETPIEEEKLPVGYPVLGRDVLIVGENGEILDFAQVGEIVVRGQYLSPGYWRQPELTRIAFEVEPGGEGIRRFYTGDLGSMSADGCLRIHGRRDTQVKVRGYRVELQEIEGILLSLEGIVQAAVVAVSEPEQNLLVAYVVPSAGQQLNEVSIRKQLLEKLPIYMVPGQVVSLQALPLTATGKIDRLALQSKPVCNASVELTQPSNDLERILCEIWREVLRRPVETNDNFFELGGNSLAAMRVVSKVIKRLQLEIPLQSLFSCPTVSEMAKLITNHQGKQLSNDELQSILAELESLPEVDAVRLAGENGRGDSKN